MIKNKNIAPDAAIDGSKIAGLASSPLTSGKIYLGNSSNVAAAVTPSGDVTITNAGVTAIGASKVTEAMINPNTLTGLVAANVANSNVIGGIPVVHMFSIANAASADYDITLTHKTKVLYCIVVKTSTTAGANANTVQVKSTASAITDAISINGAADQTIKLPATLDDSTQTIAAGGVLRVSIVRAGGDAAVDVYVIGVRSA
jgi:hypothetical protein